MQVSYFQPTDKSQVGLTQAEETFCHSPFRSRATWHLGWKPESMLSPSRGGGGRGLQAPSDIELPKVLEQRCDPLLWISNGSLSHLTKGTRWAHTRRQASQQQGRARLVLSGSCPCKSATASSPRWLCQGSSRTVQGMGSATQLLLSLQFSAKSPRTPAHRMSWQPQRATTLLLGQEGQSRWVTLRPHGSTAKQEEPFPG